MIKKSMLLLVLVISLSNISYAEQVNWNSLISVPLYRREETSCRKYFVTLQNTNVDIKYHTKITRTDTGEVIPCGGVVPEGTTIKCEIIPHDYTDIYWVGTGQYFDSPYGTWNNGAAKSSSNICVEKNFLLEETRDDLVLKARHYVEMSVNPPTKTILNCGTIANGNTKTLNENTVINFNFSDTYAKFYFGYNLISNRNACWEISQLMEIPSANGAKVPFYNSTNPSCRTGNTTLITAPFDGEYYQLNIPAQSSSCQINITVPGPAPSEPTITPLGNCITNSSMQITISGTDPENKQVKYAIDWDANGTIDQFAPSTGYVDSGTLQTVSKTYISTGLYSPKFKTINSSGASSAWVSSSFTCERTCQETTNACGQTTQVNSTNGVCPSVINTADANNTCITSFNVTTNSVNPNGSVEFSWTLPTTPNVGSRCGFVDLTTPTARPIPGLQNLDPTIDRARITNIQTTTRFCLICQFFNTTTNANLGEAIAHQWIRVIRVGEN